MANKMDQLERFEARDRKEWREWLQNNYSTSPGIWLIYYKKGSGKSSVSYDEAVEEALSLDGLIVRLIAKSNFEKFDDYDKKRILYRIKSAKRDVTRKHRIEKTVLLTSENKKPF